MKDKQEDKCPKSRNGKHQYKCTYEGWNSETWVCKHCKDRYKLYYDEMT